ncbi:hypothetical protein P4H27_09885 [Paenibacillus taichungensis]|uniref:hypothetical protein n=1 Tax=Paenibacillus taichungensis TaxID=484184 RepID=UPI002DB98882|nr:hypothetical protein [Paenibacillus taichungensis]MEC0107245.1 hypothetical protein [Paenibacillus taichungensis]MEC0194823.1 hypothetical protein [Paenibacillus taichungensis]
MIQQALQKIQKELGENSKDANVLNAGAFLRSYVRDHPEHAAFFLKEEKSIVGCLAEMREEARKNQINGVVTMVGKPAIDGMLSYFGVPIQREQTNTAPSAISASIDDLL